MAEVLLPHKLSELAQIALDDVLKVSTRPGFEIDMGTWVRSYHAGFCAVCAAGSVAIERLGISKGDSIRENEELVVRFGAHNAAALCAIDALRQGCVDGALKILADDEDPVATWYELDLESDMDRSELSRSMPVYGDDGSWAEAMSDLIADLQKAGL